MSRIAERLARLEAKLADEDKVITVTIGNIARPILIVIDGDVKSRVEAIKAWYAKHKQPMTKEHADEVKAYEKPTKHPARESSTVPRGSRRRFGRSSRQAVQRGKQKTR